MDSRPGASESPADQDEGWVHQMLKPGSLDEATWTVAVRTASQDSDRAELKRLFDLAVEQWGRERTSSLWFHLMSEADSNAQTG